MFGSWIAFLIFIAFLYFVWRNKKSIVVGIEDKEEVESDAIFTDDMSEFEKAVAFINSGKCRLSDAAKLALYGLYKQSTVGNNENPAPSAMDVVGFAKWKSWNSYRDLSKEDSEAKYVDFVTKLVPQWKEADNHEKMETTETDASFSEGGFGLKVSTMVLGNEEDWKTNDDIFSHCANGETDYVINFIQQYKDKIDEVDECGRSLLHWACDRGDFEIVKHLIENNADFSKKDADDLLPLDYACICERHDIIKYMTEHGAKLEDCQPDSLEFIQ